MIKQRTLRKTYVRLAFKEIRKGAMSAMHGRQVAALM